MKFNDHYLDELGHSPKVVAKVAGIANSVAGRAQTDGPVDTGEYIDKIHVVVSESAHRVVATVVAGADHSMIVEARTGNLLRALNAEASGG
ncbi:hypothetical protein C5E11_03880 [Clavibacter michiganensis]|nr:hypothetical protein [Clavibacter michiganensis]PPF64541.1 hypothetical protein C5E11_03880 [Clavibacter michiganensis]